MFLEYIFILLDVIFLQSFVRFFNEIEFFLPPPALMVKLWILLIFLICKLINSQTSDI